ncbi:hypothetical protein D3C86_1113290 [compost metagenome]
MLNFPLVSLTAPPDLFLTFTPMAMIGFPSVSLTVPVIFAWANALTDTKSSKTIDSNTALL